jgi:hypothetical protein
VLAEPGKRKTANPKGTRRARNSRPAPGDDARPDPADRTPRLPRGCGPTPRGARETLGGCRVHGDGRILARRDGWTVPLWTRLPEREAWLWWFVTELPGRPGGPRQNQRAGQRTSHLVGP